MPPHLGALSGALYDEGAPPLLPLPAEASAGRRCPPRHGSRRTCASCTTSPINWRRLATHCPELVFDRAAVLFGAATHDIGKILHTAELSGPGSAHQEAGRELLPARGFDARLARVAGTRGSWTPSRCTPEEGRFTPALDTPSTAAQH